MREGLLDSAVREASTSSKGMAGQLEALYFQDIELVISVTKEDESFVLKNCF